MPSAKDKLIPRLREWRIGWDAQIAHQDVAAGDAMTSVRPFRYSNPKKFGHTGKEEDRGTEVVLHFRFVRHSSLESIRFRSIFFALLAGITDPK